jgi:hypothetical protein
MRWDGDVNGGHGKNSPYQTLGRRHTRTRLDAQHFGRLSEMSAVSHTLRTPSHLSVLARRS